MMEHTDVDDESSLPVRFSNRRFVIGIYVATAVCHKRETMVFIDDAERTRTE